MSGYDSGDEANTELLQKSKINRKVLDARIENGTVHTNGITANGVGVGSTDIENKSRWDWWKSLKWKSALNHIGLLISLSIYCGVGGVVSVFNFLAFLGVRWSSKISV